MEKYFTPDITDLCIGYECEVCWSRAYAPHIWEPLVIGYKDDKGAYESTLMELVHGLDDGYLSIRVPYLTVEQIEAEGWKITYRECKEKPYKVDWINAVKGDYDLWMNLALHKDMKLGINKTRNAALYRGQCKDIHTFRKLTKLLGIN